MTGKYKIVGDLDDRADAIIRVVANKLYSERA